MNPLAIISILKKSKSSKMSGGQGDDALAMVDNMIDGRGATQGGIGVKDIGQAIGGLVRGDKKDKVKTGVTRPLTTTETSNGGVAPIQGGTKPEENPMEKLFKALGSIF